MDRCHPPDQVAQEGCMARNLSIDVNACALNKRVYGQAYSGPLIERPR